MKGQMCWLASFGDVNKILHLRDAPHQPWKPYTSSVHRVPDLQIKGASKGWTTYQKLYKAGWTLVPTAQAYSLSSAQPAAVSG
ncbi:hypothetical protein [Myxacorys almedinensis]|uniref:Uncharacterized protein n=1 Tax=Myxacorys almedinensis A TaxID=2690445 RepID=A0A8J7ZAN6_9CYAN|nr:hypothetical protein [Myxacorys almedinensis]NDJ18495.1 hypothetical protein [Myxacorys almedinensis A]